MQWLLEGDKYKADLQILLQFKVLSLDLWWAPTLCKALYLNYTITKCPVVLSASYCSAPNAVPAGGPHVPDRTRQKSESSVDLLDFLHIYLTVSFPGKNSLTSPGISHPSHSFRSLNLDGIFCAGDSFHQPEGTHSSDSSAQNSSQFPETGISKWIASNFPGSSATQAVLGTKIPILSFCFC